MDASIDAWENEIGYPDGGIKGEDVQIGWPLFKHQSTQAGERDQMKGVEESQGPVVAWMAGGGSMSGHVPGVA